MESFLAAMRRSLRQVAAKEGEGGGYGRTQTNTDGQEAWSGFLLLVWVLVSPCSSVFSSPRMLPALSLLLAALTALLLLAIVAASPRRPLPRWLSPLTAALAALVLGQALWSLQTSPLALL